MADAAYAAVFAAVAVWSWVGIVLAEAGRFHASWLFGLAVPASVVAAACAWRAIRASGRRRTSARAVAALAAVAACAAALSARPGEFLVDGNDGSVYLGIGRSLIRHHALIHPEPLLDLVPTSDWGAVFLRDRYPPHVFNLFPGGIQLYPGVNAVQPNFFHLFPVWLAMADIASGTHAPYYVSPLFSVVAIVGFWLLARALTTPLAATLASLLLVANLAQVWFARVPTTEVMAQAFTLSGVYFALLCYRRPGVTTGVLAAMAFGLACFIRVDMLAFSIPAVVCFLGVVAVERRWSSPWTWCALILAGMVAHAVAHALLVSTPYTDRLLYHAFLGRSVTAGSRILPPLVLAAGAIAFVLSRRARGSGVASRLSVLVFVAILGGAAYRIWPQVTGGYLVMLMNPLGVGLVLAGAVVWIGGDRSAPTLLILGLLLTSALVYGESVRDRTTMPTLFRRFVPVILPLSALCIGILIDRLWRRGTPWRLAVTMAWAVLVVLWASDAGPLMAATPMRGVHSEIARLAARLPTDVIVVTDQTTPSHFGLSLSRTFRRDVLWVTPTADTARALERLARRTSRPLMIARVPTETTLGVLTGRELIGFDLSPPRIETLRMTEVQPTIDRLPSTMVEREVTIEWYTARLREATAVPGPAEIGAGDLASRIGGFYEPETMGEASARWTREQAQVQLLRMPAIERATLVLRLAAPRPASMAPPVVRVALDGVEIGTTSALGAGFQLVEIPVPEQSRARLTSGSSVLTLTVPTFVPAEHGMGADWRQLGVVVDWVRVDAR